MFPDGDVLEHGLGVLLNQGRRQAVELLDRRVHTEASTFPIEVVTCRIATGERLGEDRSRTEKKLKRRVGNLRSAAGRWGVIPGEAA